ncbi:uncharacterized protein BT62DRAFT_926820 [Guyanagaster necrorhizus]|uniref:Uncharacterized protein n=1 Tax=Guyanagaster necrorhizus TaxID=856835 RepID=A0A9P7W2F0_9AGAR|nr:uncharacterized protein BT62DRAFT_926820 [Guyanagaster necrorhizus MCA 3950]KAG7451165.1 hypothetical protein BT62DRAFT_926820 [Guyanagaster necrorhizus MCA 3950]
MAPGRLVSTISVTVPRHNAPRIGKKLGAEIQAQARTQGVRTDTYQVHPDSSNALNQAIENASEWNSLLIIARAERGPQWDIGTQQFHVDQYSDLYYDNTPLREVTKKPEDESPQENTPGPQPHRFPDQPSHHSHTPHREPSHRDFPMPNMHHSATRDASPHPMRHQPAQVNYPYPASPSVRGPAPNSFAGSAPFNAGPQNFFSGAGSGGPGRGLPHDSGSIRMGGMGMEFGHPNQMSGMGGGMGGSMSSGMGGGMSGGMGGSIGGGMAGMGGMGGGMVGGGMGGALGGGMGSGMGGSMGGGMGGMGGGMGGISNSGMGGGGMGNGGMGSLSNIGMSGMGGGNMGGNMAGMGGGMGGGMAGMGSGGLPSRIPGGMMGINPDIRRMTRGMGDEGFIH